MADTPLKRVRCDDELWNAAGPACERAGTDRSVVAREAWQRVVDREHDELWQEVLHLAKDRGTTAEAIERQALEQYMKRRRTRAA